MIFQPDFFSARQDNQHSAGLADGIDFAECGAVYQKISAYLIVYKNQQPHREN